MTTNSMKQVHTFAAAVINTVASARCKNVLALGELFQQFAVRGEKPLKRLAGRCLRHHRAKATVLMKVCMSGMKCPG